MVSNYSGGSALWLKPGARAEEPYRWNCYISNLDRKAARSLTG